MNNTKNEFKNLDIQKTSHIAKFVPLTTLFGVIEHILENTFDVKLLVVDESDFTFSNQVIKMEVCSNNKMIGELYFDIFPRKNKPFLNCHYTLRGRKTEPVFQHPSVYLLLNPPLLEQYSTPGMSYESAIMVMHELGHCFHSIFYNGSYQHLSGTRCSTDIAEIPSMLFEKFFTDPQVKNMLFINNNLKSDVDTSYLLKAETIYRTTVDSIVDLSINSADDRDFVKIINRVIKERNLVLQVNPTIHYQYFSHLIHYPSKYYSYLWAEGCANMIWCELFQRNALNQHAGDVFKRCFLQKGAMVESEDFIESMLCKKFSSKTLSNYSLY
ncbi:Mitochondrial intermediate peptidase [Thelohanellus kitauei]|uniref:Mitochondrial intermediate peptidase n=1 Tax=Thelohanellus kitauei TaxID=669202 RepID=A0A0C2MF03_THEKT|nr:Mitochondrial intermediate peptidase [Thelohanellus kitauei]